MSSRNFPQSVRRIKASNKPNACEINALKTSKLACATQSMTLNGSVLGGDEPVKDVNGVEVLQNNKDGVGRERLKRHRDEVAGSVLIPDKWGQEELLKDWIDCSAFEALLVPKKIASARRALAAEGRRASSTTAATTSRHQQLRIESRC